MNELICMLRKKYFIIIMNAEFFERFNLYFNISQH